MSPRWRPALFVTVVAVALFTALVLRGRERSSPVVQMAVPGDVDEAIATMDTTVMPAQARALLQSDRPWRAARVMRRYLQLVPSAPPEHRVLAAKAEAGWGGWAEVGVLLETVPALENYDDGIGLHLLGRAREEAGDLARAAQAYRAFLALGPASGVVETERAAAQLRLALVLTRAGQDSEAAALLLRSTELASNAEVWIRLLTADALATRGDTAAVRARVASFDRGALGLRGWRARVTAAQQARDMAGARALAERAAAWARTSATKSEFMVSAARLAFAMGDSSGAREALLGALELDAAGPYARQAAELLRAGEPSVREHLALARVQRAQGLHEQSLAGYREWLDARIGTALERAAVQLEYADALFYAERYDEVKDALEPVARETAARRLRGRAEERLGRYGAAVRIYLDLAEDAGAGVGAADPLLLAAGARHDAGELDEARELYERVVSLPPNPQTALAFMRLGGIAFVEKDYADAARRWDDYLRRYPRGALVTQATYWSGRAREESGDTVAAKRRFRAVRELEPDSYYALLASERLGEPFWPIPVGDSPASSSDAAARVELWVRGLDLLRAAGFQDEASAEADRLVETLGRDRPTRYALAEALAVRGYSQRAIRIGTALRGDGPPDARLLRILHPFPHRKLVLDEARERGLDPFMAAALIRQESLFEARATSHVGARGLMQIMPATGQQLAEAAGLESWDPELLYHPEINVHLGTRYLAQHNEEYDGSLPAVFSAYNAGPHRVEWWSEFPEYGQDELFTERIPFLETREYVKILTRNLAVYRGLYGVER